MILFACSRSTITTFRRSGRWLAAGVASAVCLSLGCAQPVPGHGNGSLSGRRIHVIMQFESPPEPNLYYFFLINKYGPYGDPTDTHGPVPVIGPEPSLNNGLGNGFATTSEQNTTGMTAGLPDYGITDFVLYSSQALNRLALYHFTNSATSNVNNQQVSAIANPTTQINPVFPENATSYPQTNQIQFDVDMSQLFPDLAGQARINAGKLVRYLQVNIVATNSISVDPNNNVIKEVDAMGNTLDLSTTGKSFLTIDLNTGQTYTSGDNISSLNESTSANDVYPPGPNATSSLNLVSWSIQVQPGS